MRKGVALGAIMTDDETYNEKLTRQARVILDQKTNAELMGVEPKPSAFGVQSTTSTFRISA